MNVAGIKPTLSVEDERAANPEPVKPPPGEFFLFVHFTLFFSFLSFFIAFSVGIELMENAFRSAYLDLE